MVRDTVGMFQYIVMSAADMSGPSTMAGVNAMDIITATKKSARALATMQRHAHAMRDAQRYGDAQAYTRATRLYERSKKIYLTAFAATAFPWERKTS